MCGWVTAVMAALCFAGYPQSQPATRPDAATVLELRESRFIDLHYFVRHQSQATTTAAVRPAWTESFDGKLTRAAALAQIVAKTVSGSPQK